MSDSTNPTYTKIIDLTTIRIYNFIRIGIDHGFDPLLPMVYKCFNLYYRVNLEYL